MYAHDVLLYKELETEQDAEKLQTGFSTRYQENRMKMDVEKTELVIFQRNRQQTEPTLFLQGQVTPYREEMKYLQLIIDKHMSFVSHLKMKITDADRRLITIRKMTRMYWGASPTAT